MQSQQNTILRKYNIDSYLRGLEIVDQIARMSEQLNHHPKITLNHNNVEVETFTHEVNSVTEKDQELIKYADSIANSKIEERDKIVAAAFTIFKKDGKVLLLQRQNTGWSDGWWDVPAGHVDYGENPLKAAVREAQEEVGATPTNITLKHVSVVSYDKDIRHNFYFECSSWEGEIINNEPHKHSESKWFDQNNLPEKTLEHTKTAINSKQLYSYHANKKFSKMSEKLKVYE